MFSSFPTFYLSVGTYLKCSECCGTYLNEEMHQEAVIIFCPFNNVVIQIVRRYQDEFGSDVLANMDCRCRAFILALPSSELLVHVHVQDVAA